MWTDWNDLFHLLELATRVLAHQLPKYERRSALVAASVLIKSAVES